MAGQHDRRQFLVGALSTTSALAAGYQAALAAQETAPAAAPASGTAEPAPPPLRVGVVGIGDRGLYLVNLLLGMDAVEVVAVCDPVEAKTARAQGLAHDRKRRRPDAYSQGPEAYRLLCRRPDVELVINATPWALHTAVCRAALEAGKHAATEAPLAPTIDECWTLVEAARQAQRHCALIENYAYQRDVMLVWNLVRRGLFGELLHLEGGYQRDARAAQFRTTADGQLDSVGQFDWLGQCRQSRRGYLFPTHDLGPLSQWLEIHRGDRFDYLVSMGGNARALNAWVAEQFGPQHPLATTPFDMADVNSCLIRTVKGRTIYLVSDLLHPRPQPRTLYRLQATRGAFDRTTDRLYIAGRSPRRDGHHGEWEAVSKYFEEFDHPWWRAMRHHTIGTGQGGVDYLCLDRLIQALRRGQRPDFDVHDAAALSSVIELSERSARQRSRPVEFPDFTGGRWETTPPTPFPGT